MLVTDPIIPIFSRPLSRLLEAGGHEAGGGPTRIQLLWPGRLKLPGCLPSLPPPPVHSTSVGVPLAEVGVLSHTAVKADVAPLTRLHRSGPRHAKERRRRRQCQVSSKDRSSSHLGVGCPLGKGMRENRRGSWPSNTWMVVTTGKRWPKQRKPSRSTTLGENGPMQWSRFQVHRAAGQVECWPACHPAGGTAGRGVKPNTLAKLKKKRKKHRKTCQELPHTRETKCEARQNKVTYATFGKPVKKLAQVKRGEYRRK